MHTENENKAGNVNSQVEVKQACGCGGAYGRVLGALQVKSGKNILDVGCGAGGLVKAATDLGLKAFGVDVSDKAVELARKSAPNCDIRVARGEALPFSDGSFDFIACIDALQKFQEIDRCLQQMRRVARKDARLCISVPNRKAFSGVKPEGKEIVLALDEWKALFAKNGLAVETVAKGCAGKGMLNKLIGGFLPLGMAAQFVFILKKN